MANAKPEGKKAKQGGLDKVVFSHSKAYAVSEGLDTPRERHFNCCGSETFITSVFRMFVILAV